VVLVGVLVGWILSAILSEYNVRKLQALGVTVSSRLMPEVFQAAQDVCERFGVEKAPRIVVLASGETNALAMRFAHKRVVVILSSLLEGLLNHPAQLRALLAHEICHLRLDHGPRGTFEIYKPAKYRQARELTCDNAGLIASGDLQETKTFFKKLCVGYRLHQRLDDEALVDDASAIYSGFHGWLLRRHLSHPPAGARVENAESFYQDNAEKRA
jgi:Zn-dependent protease with chaperone function